MKHLDDLIEVLIRLGVIKDKGDFGKYVYGDPLRDPNAIATMSLAEDIITATANLQQRALRDIYELRRYADGFEEDITDLD